jgi:hypothetical protein
MDFGVGKTHYSLSKTCAIESRAAQLRLQRVQLHNAQWVEFPFWKNQFTGLKWLGSENNREGDTGDGRRAEIERECPVRLDQCIQAAARHQLTTQI